MPTLISLANNEFKVCRSRAIYRAGSLNVDGKWAERDKSRDYDTP
ncbi:hypothetical protein [Reticulibacter mediterranei]|nr:hypothetical protein [Reticulibacter mediterranei]